MRIVVDQLAQKVHLQNLDWGDVGLIQELAANEAVTTENDGRFTRLNGLIEIIDAGIESVFET